MWPHIPEINSFLQYIVHKLLAEDEHQQSDIHPKW